MKIQVNSDNTVSVDARMKTFVKGEVNRILGRFAAKLTRIEVHLADIDKKKRGPSDKRCLVEARPAGADPRSTNANADDMKSAVDQSLRKMQRALTTFFGKQGWTPVEISAPVLPVRKAVRKKTAAPAKKKAVAKKKLSPRGPKKKMIFQARRKAWPKI